MKLLLRKLLLLPFCLLALAVDTVGKCVRLLIVGQVPARKSDFHSGISIVIPERANQEMLRRCLQSLGAACALVDEPVEVIVVVSDAREDSYRDLIGEFPVRWIFESRPLWFIEAVARGVRAATYHWVYLLNNDMLLDRDALREVAQWRSPAVFAIASQIYFQDSAKRREETGLTDARIGCKLFEIFDAEPENDFSIRSHLYAGGGSSLFQRDLLKDFIEQTKGYAPAYWEDVEWGVLAWRRHFEVLFCPQSKVWHAHRSTILKFFPTEEIDRIFKRNRLRFQLRTSLPAGSLRTVFGSIARSDRASFKEMLQPVLMLDTLQARFRTYFDPPLRLEEIPVSGVQHCGRRRPGFPLILIVSPYCVYPPAHGGARRIHELIERCAREFDIILLSDEAENYTEASFKYFKSCHIVSLVGGREAPKTDHRIERIQAHSHAALAVQLRRLVEVHAPDIVQIEYVELAKLIEHRDQRPWILTLHDVLLESADKGTRDEDEFELQYINRFDAVMVCGSEDRALLKRDNVHVIRNGAHTTKQYVPSREVSPILFIGPFRYPPNLVGIIEFLERVFPEVRSKVPNAKLWILGGPDAPKTAAREPSFAQPGVTVFDFIEDVTPYLKDCSITINPDKGVRGSSLKVIESLAAGRVCVSTRDGARGLLKSALPSLVVVDDEEFADRVVQLITDSDFRHRLEIPSEELHRYSWQRASEDQARIYRSLLETGYSSRTFAFGPANTLER